ncbi:MULTISPECIES: hypothetical protein [Acidianus]|uniref:Uncharacterized protein n=1 Tax=Candidatus Acidianus copahuensis TaxID=1160895 RepID=A0A031LR28_9CREN|nr:MULTISPECIES: hypothetical protein [Acidianus]EZQ06834.1 hypothetical protein CM19_05530 [Candidatus Acidianus copahuensis]NON61489.1 hypothetical protein [Acidianus sp. RZ1]
MRHFKAKVSGETLILENVSGVPLLVRELLIKYYVKVTTEDERTGIRTITDSIPLNVEIRDNIQIPLKISEVAGVSVIFKEGEITMREEVTV